MNHKFSALVFFFSFFILLYPNFLLASESSGKLLLITENFPPFNYKEDNRLKGISVDILAEILEKTNSKMSRKDIQIWPWARGYNTLMTKENTCLFSTMHSPERKNIFKWVGPISPINNGLIALKKRQLTIENFEDIKKLKIGVGIDDIGEQLLIKKGIDSNNLDRMGGMQLVKQNILKLKAGRINAFSYSHKVTQWEAKQMGLDPTDFEMVYTLHTGAVYYAFNIKTSDEIIIRFQKALDELEKDGVIDKIIKSYTN